MFHLAQEGRSLWSATTALRTGAAPPDIPVALQVVTYLTTSATLAWGAPENENGSKVTAYEVIMGRAYVRWQWGNTVLKLW